jgi:hypothetical protein
MSDRRRAKSNGVGEGGDDKKNAKDEDESWIITSPLIFDL